MGSTWGLANNVPAIVQKSVVPASLGLVHVCKICLCLCKLQVVLGQIVQRRVVPASLGLVHVCKICLCSCNVQVVLGRIVQRRVVPDRLGFRARVLPEVMSRPSASLSGCLASSFWGAGPPPWGSAWAFFGSETACKYLGRRRSFRFFSTQPLIWYV